MCVEVKGREEFSLVVRVEWGIELVFLISVFNKWVDFFGEIFI